MYGKIILNEVTHSVWEILHAPSHVWILDFGSFKCVCLTLIVSTSQVNKKVSLRQGMARGRNGRKKVENTNRKYRWDLTEIVVKR